MAVIFKLFILIICIYLLCIYLNTNINNNFCYSFLLCKRFLTDNINYYYIENKTLDIYKFINTLTKLKTDIMNLNNTDIIKMDTNDILYNKILLYLNYIFNTGNYLFNNIKIVNNIYYYKNQFGKYIKSLIITSDISLIKNNNVLFKKKLTMVLQCFIYDKKYYYTCEDNITILSINIINNDKTLDNFISQDEIIDNISNIDNNIISNNDISNIISSDNSLIPSLIDLSD